MLRKLMIARSIIVIGAAAGVGLIAGSREEWMTVAWCVTAAFLAAEHLNRDRRSSGRGADRCVRCGRRRLGGGVFVAGIGSICFECEEREFGVELDQSPPKQLGRAQ